MNRGQGFSYTGVRFSLPPPREGGGSTNRRCELPTALRPLPSAPRLAFSSLRAQECRHVIERQRFAEEVALQLVASKPIQYLGLFLRIDTLGDDFEPQRMSH